MNPLLVFKLSEAETIEDLKRVIAEILDEYDYGILEEHERRIEELEND